MNKHTPGPWSHAAMQPSIWDATEMIKVAQIEDLPWQDGKSDWITEEANATLIAAAPTLLEAVQEAQAFLASLLGSKPDEATYLLTNAGEDVESTLSTAIAKATS